MLDFVTRTVEISCLPKDIPETIVADVSGLELGHYLRASDLVLPSGVKLVSETNVVIAHCVAPKAEEEPKPAEAAAAEGAEGAEAAPKAEAGKEAGKEKSKEGKD
jgi:large subunit ribosomal protein L25